MPNPTTFDRLVGSNSPAQGKDVIPSQIPSTTSPTVVTNQRGSAAVLTVSKNLPGASTTAPSFGIGLDGFGFKIRIVGKVTTTASANITVALCQGTTYVSGNVIATTSAQAVNSSSSNFMVEATILWDNISQIMQGLQTSFLGQLTNGTTALQNEVTVTAQSSLQFVPVITTSSAGNATFSITEFVADSL